MDFHVFAGRYWGGVKSDQIGIFFLQKLGSGLVVQRFRYHFCCTVVCALSSGHGHRGQGFEGFSKILDFHDFF